MTKKKAASKKKPTQFQQLLADYRKACHELQEYIVRWQELSSKVRATEQELFAAIGHGSEREMRAAAKAHQLAVETNAANERSTPVARKEVAQAALFAELMRKKETP